MKYNREELETTFKTGTYWITFIKVSGEERTMYCTRDSMLVPEEKSPKDKRSYKKNDDVFSVWDLEKEGWRSFKISNLIHLRRQF